MTVQSLIKQTIALEPLLYCIWKIKKKNIWKPIFRRVLSA